MNQNLRDLEPQTQIRMANGSIVEVIENPKDGIWIMVRYLECPDDASLAGTEEMVSVGEVFGLA